MSYSPWGCKELDTTEQLTHTAARLLRDYSTHHETQVQKNLMNSQGSDSNEEDYDPNCEEEEEDEDPGDIEDYYVGVASDVEQQGADSFDPEEYQFTCLTYKESEGALNEHMTSLASVLKVSSVVSSQV